MKKLFIGALALSMFTACSQDEIVEQQQLSSAITFDGAFVDNATRTAADPSTTTSSINAFDVWGFMDNTSGLVFDGQRVTGSKSGGWSYSPLQYWLPGHTYYFAAVSPVDDANIKVGGTPNEYGLGTIAFTNTDGGTDLLYAATSVSTEGKTVNDSYANVAFTFNHLLSKVKFSFTNGFAADNYSIKVSNIVMSVPAEGSIDLAQDKWWEGCKWTTNEGKVDIAFGDMNDGNALGAGEDAESANERLTIPADGEMEYIVKFDVVLYSGSVVAYESSLQTTITGTPLEIGKAYNFHATLDQTNIFESELKPIVFEVTEVKEWVDGNGYNGDGEDGENRIDTKIIDVKTETDLHAAFAVENRSDAAEKLIVRLYNDITLSSTLNVQKDGELDLNGKTLTNQVGNSTTDVIVVAAGKTLTINGNGKVAAVTGNDGYAVIADGTVIINSGEFTSGKDANDEANAVIYARGSGQVYVNGGTFPNASNSIYVLNKKDADKSTTKIEVKGGVFTNFNPAISSSENPEENFVAEGYISIKDGDNYKVCPEGTLQSVADATSLQNALNAGGTNIVLTGDITAETTLYAANNATLNLNGHSIKNTATTGNTDVIIVNADVELIINDAADKAVVEAATGGDGYPVIAEGTLTVNGGTFKSGLDKDGYQNAVIYARGNGNITINGGIYQCADAASTLDADKRDYRYTINKKDGDRGTTTITVTGGKFYRFNPADNAAEGAGTTFVATDYKSYAVDADWFAVVKAETTTEE